LLIVLSTVVPPHVYPVSWGVCLALAALMGAAAAPARRFTGPAMALAAAVVTLIALNVGFSIQRLESIRTLAAFAAGGMVLLFCARLSARAGEDEASPARGLLPGVLIACGTGLALIGAYQSLYRFGALAGRADIGASEAVRARLESGRAVATLGLPAALAGILIMTLPLTAAWTWRVRGRPGFRAVGTLLCAVQAAGLLATRSAAAVAALAFAAALVTWVGAPAAEGRELRRRLGIAASLVAAGVLVAGALLVSRAARESAGVDTSSPIAWRLGNWEVAARILAHEPLQGVGLGAYGIAFPRYREWGMNESRYAHNTYLQLLAEGGVAVGIPALALALLLAIALLRRMRAARRRGDLSASFVTAGAVAFLVHNTVDFTAYVPSVAFVFCCLTGTLIGARWRRGVSPVSARASMAVASLALAAVALVVTRGDMAIEDARGLALQGRTNEAIERARGAAVLDPIDPEPHGLLADLLLERAVADHRPDLLEEAAAQASRAVRLDPETPHRWHLLGRVRLAAADPQGAYIALHRAAALYPIRLEYREDRDAVAARLRGEETPR